MARAESVQDFDDLRDELRDRFGPVPTLVENLLQAMNVRRQMVVRVDDCAQVPNSQDGWHRKRVAYS